MKKRIIALGVAALVMTLYGVVSPAIAAEDETPKDWKKAAIGDVISTDSKGEVVYDKVIGGTTYRPRSCGSGTINDYYYQSVSECNVRHDAENQGLMDTINTIINVVLGVIGFLAVAMIIMGGISFATSQGDVGKTTKAKHTILFGIVGLIIALLAFAIVNFVLSNVFKPTV